MPYITQQSREYFDTEINALVEKLRCLDAGKSGSVNYVISRIVAGAFKNEKWNYKSINEAAGVYKCAGDEFQRRIVSPYEDSKIANPDNGDIGEYASP